MNEPNWEIAVLGTLIEMPLAYEEVEGQLSASDFIYASHQKIFRAIAALSASRSIETRAIMEILRTNGDLNEIGSEINPSAKGEAYFQYLKQFSGTQIKVYVDYMIEQVVRRNLKEAGYLIAADALDNSRPIETLLDEAEGRLYQMRRNRNNDVMSMGEMMGVYVPYVNGLLTGETKPAWSPHVKAIRDVIGYFDEKDLIIIAARPGEGKTSWMKYELMREAMSEGGKPTLIINLENNPMEFPKTILCMLTGISNNKLKNPRLLSQKEIEVIKEAIPIAAKIPFYQKEMFSPTVNEIETVTRKAIATHKIGIVGVDYIQLISNETGGNRVDDISITTRRLRAMAMKYAIPLIAASQLNRSIEHRGEDAEPRLSDLRESGSLEQDGTVVMFVRQAWSNPTEADIRVFPENVDSNTGQVKPLIEAAPVKFYILKNRNGPTGITRPVKWNKANHSFAPMEMETTRINLRSVNQ